MVVLQTQFSALIGACACVHMCTMDRVQGRHGLRTTPSPPAPLQHLPPHPQWWHCLWRRHLRLTWVLVWLP